MDLESRVDSRLWATIQSSYQNRDYRTAILDSIHFLSQLIRDKSGLESDGQALAGEALGGLNPKLRVNNLQTESDKNVQKGVEALLRGLYQAIRNPRSHGKHTDSSQDAEALILFVDFLVRSIDKSKSVFDENSFLGRVCQDPYYPTGDERYAELLVEEIPGGKRLDILIKVYNLRNADNARKLREFCGAMLNVLSPDEVVQFCSIVSDDLKTTVEDSAIRATIQMVPEECWPRYVEASRIRIEKKLIESVGNGKFNSVSGKLLSGGLGTWISQLAPHISKLPLLVGVLTRKLASNDAHEEDYVFNYFFSSLYDLQPVPNQYLIKVIHNGLQLGDKRYYDRLSARREFLGLPEAWEKEFSSALDSFQEANPSVQGSGITDDDVPF